MNLPNNSKRKIVGTLSLENGKKFQIYYGLNIIGRNKEATVNIPDIKISQHHSIITVINEGAIYLSDLNSTNGTFLDFKLQPFVLYQISVYHKESKMKFGQIKATFSKLTDGENEAFIQPELSQSLTQTFYHANTQIINESQLTKSFVGTENIHEALTQAVDENSDNIRPINSFHVADTEIIIGDNNLIEKPLENDPNQSKDVSLKNELEIDQNQLKILDSQQTQLVDEESSNDSVDLAAKPNSNDKSDHSYTNSNNNNVSESQSLLDILEKSNNSPNNPKNDLDDDDTDIEQDLPKEAFNLSSDSEIIKPLALKKAKLNHILSSDTETQIKDSDSDTDIEESKFSNKNTTKDIFDDSDLIPATQDDFNINNCRKVADSSNEISFKLKLSNSGNQDGLSDNFNLHLSDSIGEKVDLTKSKKFPFKKRIIESSESQSTIIVNNDNLKNDQNKDSEEDTCEIISLNKSNDDECLYLEPTQKLSSKNDSNVDQLNKDEFYCQSTQKIADDQESILLNNTKNENLSLIVEGTILSSEIDPNETSERNNIIGDDVYLQPIQNSQNNNEEVKENLSDNNEGFQHTENSIKNNNLEKILDIDKNLNNTDSNKSSKNNSESFLHEKNDQKENDNKNSDLESTESFSKTKTLNTDSNKSLKIDFESSLQEKNHEILINNQKENDDKNSDLESTESFSKTKTLNTDSNKSLKIDSESSLQEKNHEILNDNKNSDLESKENCSKTSDLTISIESQLELMFSSPKSNSTTNNDQNQSLDCILNINNEKLLNKNTENIQNDNLESLLKETDSSSSSSKEEKLLNKDLETSNSNKQVKNREEKRLSTDSLSDESKRKKIKLDETQKENPTVNLRRTSRRKTESSKLSLKKDLRSKHNSTLTNNLETVPEKVPRKAGRPKKSQSKTSLIQDDKKYEKPMDQPSTSRDDSQNNNDSCFRNQSMVLLQAKSKRTRKRPSVNFDDVELQPSVVKCSVSIEMATTFNGTPERSRRKTKPKVVFTMMKDPQLEIYIRQLGGLIVDSIEGGTVLVTEEVKRTPKLLAAVGLSKPICSPAWILESVKNKSFLDPWDYILKDKKAESKWDFNLRESLRKSSESKLFKSYSFMLIVNKDTVDALKGAIEVCGGKCVSRIPASYSADKLIVVSSEEMSSRCNKIKKDHPDIKIIEKEAVFDAVLRQQIRFERHYL